ncbi:MAG: POTRA domain-containing protein, partial [Bdellovibrionales bacterium]
MISLNLLFQFLFVFQGSQAHAACPADQQFQFKSITVAGNSKTITSVILRELNISPYQLVCQEQIDDGLNRIRRTGLFSQADYQTQEDSLLVNVNERWTTIPIVKGNSGGGVSQFTLGVYDPNIYGEFLEAGAQYENLAGASSGVLWFKNPRLFDQYQGVDLQYWNIKRIRVKYDQKSYSPLIKNGFLQEREKIYAGYFREISRDHVLRFSLDYNSDDFSTDFLSDEVNEKNGPNPILPPQSKLIISTLGYEMGRIQGETQSLEGSQLGLYIGYAQSLNSDVKSFV